MFRCNQNQIKLNVFTTKYPFADLYLILKSSIFYDFGIAMECRGFSITNQCFPFIVHEDV